MCDQSSFVFELKRLFHGALCKIPKCLVLSMKGGGGCTGNGYPVIHFILLLSFVSGVSALIDRDLLARKFI